MSGAASLAAAKRRRGGSNQPAPPSPGIPNGQTQTQKGVRITPIQALQQHNVRIARLETGVKALEQKEGGNGVPEDFMKRVEMLEKSVVERVSEVRVGEKTNPIETKEDLEYFRTKTLELEQQISELKQMMLKIQTFAMETSMSLMKYKNGMEIGEQEPIDVLKEEPELQEESDTQREPETELQTQDDTQEGNTLESEQSNEENMERPD
jgi:hypothetical protein